MSYMTKYKPENPDKYKGDPTNIVCRSLWERWLCKWLDRNNNVVFWSSEEISIRYFDPIQKKWRRYFPDFFVEFNNGRRIIIEVKPKNQTIAPQNKKKKSFMKEQCTYINNRSKWNAAIEFCSNNNLEFHVFTEETLKKMGMKYGY